MSRRAQFVDAAGLRGDGRRPAEPRIPTFDLGTLPGTDGSCVFSCGATVVNASVLGPRHGMLRGGDVRSEEASLACRVVFSAVSGERRRQAKRGNRITDEFGAALSQALDEIVLLSNYPNASITVSIEVLQADGNELESCINAASLALANAGVAMKDLVVACSAGVIDGQVVTDLTATEVRSGCPVLHLGVLAHDPTAIVVMSMDARVSDSQLDEMYTEAVNGAISVSAALATTLRADVERRIEQRGVAGFLQEVK